MLLRTGEKAHSETSSTSLPVAMVPPRMYNTCKYLTNLSLNNKFCNTADLIHHSEPSICWRKVVFNSKLKKAIGSFIIKDRELFSMNKKDLNV